KSTRDRRKGRKQAPSPIPLLVSCALVVLDATERGGITEPAVARLGGKQPPSQRQNRAPHCVPEGALAGGALLHHGVDVQDRRTAAISLGTERLAEPVLGLVAKAHVYAVDRSAGLDRTAARGPLERGGVHHELELRVEHPVAQALAEPVAASGFELHH